MNQERYDEINRLLKDLAEDLDLPPAVFNRIYVGSGEDFSAALFTENSYVSH